MVESSVVIPAYNEEKYIGKALQSLTHQSYKDFEIIVVDDGSTDKTIEIIKKFKKVRLIKGQHRGPGFSRNLGAKNARGKILVFVDADMTFDKDYLKNLIAPITNDTRVLGTTHDYEIATNTHNLWSRLWGKMRVHPDQASQLKIFRAIRKKNFLDLGGFDPAYGYADDQTFWFKYHLKATVAKNTICYHRNPETLDETHKQARWIGASWKSRFEIFSIPVLNAISYFFLRLFFYPLLLLIVLRRKKTEDSVPFNQLILFYHSKLRGYLDGLGLAIFSDYLAR